MIREWNGTNISFARQTKVLFPTPLFRRTRRLLPLPSPLFSQLVCWLTGHAFLGLQNFRCGSVATCFCGLCGQVPERSDHLLLRSILLTQLKARSFKAWNLGPQPGWEVDGIICFLTDPAVETLENPTNTPEEISRQQESEDEQRQLNS